MDKSTAQRTVSETFKAPFDRTRYSNFIKEICNNFDESKQISSMAVPEAFNPHIKSCQRLGTFTDPAGEKADILIVHLKESFKLERTRTALRNFVAQKLKRDNSYKEAGLVAFVSSDSSSWRFSYVRMEYEEKRDPVTNKFKIEERLTPARRYSYLVGPDEQCHTAQTRFLSLLQNTSDPPVLKQIEDAFSVESVTKEFFIEYKRLFDETERALTSLVNQNQSTLNEFRTKSINVADFSKKLLGQIVFLYFLQKKGWLGVARGKKWGDGPHDFLRTQADLAISQNHSFFNDVLAPLFYDTLATDRGTDAWCRTLKCRIPFLNGGLFEPIGSYDWKHTNINLPNTLFTNHERSSVGDEGTGILDVFDRYNFTVNEAEPLEKEVAIDPEMLGKVFENLIEENRRKGLGAFYTPREIVHYMCQESLINYLDTTLNRSGQILQRTDIETFICKGEQVAHYEAASSRGTKNQKQKLPDSVKIYAQHAQAIDAALHDIKVCDPAIGSGAFPVAMMLEIVRARLTLTPYFNNISERTPYIFKRHVIQNSLYGVDIDVGAVEIAKLRLWLSLVVDEEDPEHIKPLPNLDYKIVAGNSLIDFPFKSKRLGEIEDLKLQLFDETNQLKKMNLKSQIDALLATVFAASQKSLGYTINFSFQILFSEVFKIKGGFDLVIGNPPYIKEYTNREAFDGTRNSPYYQGKMDIWYMFACLGLDLLKQNSGLLSFIATNNWITNSGASLFRNKIVNDATILKLIDFGSFKIFESASIQTMVLICAKNNQMEQYNFDLRKITNRNPNFKDVIDIINGTNNDSVVYLNPLFDRSVLQDKNLVFSNDAIESILANVAKKKNFVLNERDEVAQGIVSPQDFVNKASLKILGNSFQIGDGIFVISDEEKNSLSLSIDELNLIRPYYTTSELGKYAGDAKNINWVIYTDSSFKNPIRMKMYPNIKRHLDKFKDIITSDNRPYGLHRSRNENFFKGNKIISLRKCTEPTFTYTEFDCYVSQTFNIIKTNRINLKYLTAILNSKLIACWLQHKGKMQGNIYQVDKEPLLEIPIFLALPDQQKKIINLVDQIISAKTRNYQANVSILEKQIDTLVYNLYELTEDEVATLESTE